jgi:MarR family
MAPVDAIEDVRARLEGRLEELRPYVEEARRIERLLVAIDATVVHELGPGPVTGAAPRLPAETRKLQILSLLGDRGELRIKALAEALKLTPGRIVQLVDEMEQDGTARRVNRGVKITGAGLDLVPPEVRITRNVI